MRHAAEHEFLDVLYGAAADPALWTQSMEMFADLVGGSSAWLSRLSVVDGSGSAITARIDPEMPRLYREHYSRLNPFSTAPDPRRYMAGWEPRVVTDEAWMHGADLVRTEYFNDFMRPQDVHGCMIVRLQSHDLEVSALTINHGRPGGGFTPQELALAERLRPHIRRAYDLTGKLGHAGLMSEAVETVLDHTSHAILILDEHLRVGRMNRAAERLVAGPDGLRVVGGRLRTPATADARRLDALLAAASAREPAARRGGGMALRLAEGQRPLSITVSPVRGSRLAVFGEKPAILVGISDGRAPGGVSEDDLIALLGLTRAEARVAVAIAAGATARAAARELGLSFHTVRHQIQSVIEKSGVGGKVELVAMLARLGGPSDATPRG